MDKLRLEEIFKYCKSLHGSYNSKAPPAQSLDEIWWLLEKAREVNLEIRAMLEIGITIESAIMWLLILPENGLYIGIDVASRSRENISPHISNRFFEIICGASNNQETIKKVPEILHKYGYDNLDLLYIDGVHFYEGVSSDFKNYSPFIKRGLVGFHDLTYPNAPDVKRFFDEISGKKEMISFEAGIGLYFKED